MKKDLFLLILALIISAIWKIDLLWTIAVVDTADRLFRLLRHSYIAMKQSPKRKSPSSSAKRNGRLRKRS